MPYRIFSRDGKYAVYRVSGGAPQGERLGTHDTREAAATQVRALYASETPDKAVVYKVPEAVQEACRTGVSLRREYGYGGTAREAELARAWASGAPVSSKCVLRMQRYFARCGEPVWGSDGAPSAAYIRFLLHGGAEAQRWTQGLSRAVAEGSTGKTVQHSGGRVKALSDEGIVGGLLVAFGLPRDAEGEYFTPETRFYLDWYTSRPALYDHGLDEVVRKEKIGEIIKITPLAEGLYAEAKLDLTAPAARRAYAMARDGLLGWSSGSIPHLVEVSGDGRIQEWPIVEGSLTRTPAEPERTRAQVIKSTSDFATLVRQYAIKHTKGNGTMHPVTIFIPLLEGAGLNPEQILSVIKALQELHSGKPSGEALRAMEFVEPLTKAGVSPDVVLSLLPAIDDTLAEMAKSPVVEPAPVVPEEEMSETGMAMDMEEDLKAEMEEELSTKAEVDEEKLKAGKARAIAALHRNRNATSRVPAVSRKSSPLIRSRSKYAGMSWQDMSFLATVLRASAKARQEGVSPLSDDFRQEYAAKALADANDGRVEFSENAIKSLVGMKSLNTSTGAGYGDEFVAEGWRATLWEKPRIDNVVAQNTIFIPMPQDPYKLPIESTDPVVYAVSQTANENQLGINDSNAAIPDTRVATANTTMTSGKLALRVGVAEELQEDSIIPVVTLWRQQAVRAMEDARDNVLLNADDETGSTNINQDGASATAGSKFLYGGGNGFLELPLSTDTTLSVDNGGGYPTLSKIREARRKLGRHMISDLANLVIYVDPLTYVSLLQVDELNTFLNNGQFATVMTGEVGRIDNIPVFVTNEMASAQGTNGKVSNTAGSNTKGRLAIVHKPSWIAGYRREIRTAFEYISYLDAWQLTVTMRMALVRRSADCSAVLYNIAI